MTRSDITPAIQAELASAEFMVLPLVFLDIVGDPVRVWGGIDTLSWDGHSWDGIGNLGQVGAIKSDNQGAIAGLSLNLSTVNDTPLRDAAKAGDYMGRLAYVWIGVFDTDNHNLIDDPVLMFSGEMSTITLINNRTDPSISVDLESRMAILGRAMPRFRTDEDQERLYPGDRFFEFVPAIMNKTIYWGLDAPTVAMTGAGSIGPGSMGPYGGYPAGDYSSWGSKTL